MLRRCLPTNELLLLRYPRSLRTIITRHVSTKVPTPSIKSNASTLSTSKSKPLNPSPRRLITTVLTLFVLTHLTTRYAYSFLPCDGISMLPTINSAGDYVLISKWYRRGRGIKVGDCISFAHPVDAGGEALKRVIGLEGDFVLRDTPGVGGEAVVVQVPQGHCWVVGDNVTFSRDSRLFGPLPLALIKGKIVARMDGRWRWEWMRNGLVVPEDENDVD